MILNEIADVMDDAGDGDEGFAVASLLLEVLEFNDGQLLDGNPPVELGTGAVELLLELLDAALLDLVGSELLEVVGETELFPGPDAPFGGVVLMPLDGVPVITGELVVEVVVSLPEGDEGGDDVVPGRVAVVEGLVPEPVGEGVDAE